MRTWFCAALLVLSTPAALASDTIRHFHSGLRPSRAIVISIDGLRPDVLLRADAPVLDRLMERGARTLRARTTALCNTLPSHTTMVTGVPPSQHGVDWNHALPADRRKYPLVPTLFERARQAGLTTALVAGKPKFLALDKPGSLGWSRVWSTNDATVAANAVELIATHAPQVMFVHFPGVDRAGHTWGWNSWAQRRAIAQADRCVGQILGALRDRGLLDSTLVIVTSDHGGNGRNHRPEDPLSQRVPWIVAGPGIRPADLDESPGPEIRLEDTFFTVCTLLGFRSPDTGPVPAIPAGSQALPGAPQR
jgi:arylsulfatase A-like enzyme